MSPPKPISVLMAVHNGMPYLQAAMESILSQTFSDFELLVIDDRSTDDSRAYLAAIKDPRLHMLSSPGKGLTAALNFGLQQAQGEWVARMDADDWSFPERFARQLEAARRPGTVLISADHVICDEEMNPVGEIRLAPPNPQLFAYLHKRNNPFCHPVMMFSRQAALAVGGYRYERAQDYDLWIRLLEKGELAHVPEILLKYRVRRQAISIQHVEEQSQARVAIQKQVENTAGNIQSRGSAGPYAYRLGFAAWLAGRRMSSSYYMVGSVLHGHNVGKSLMALILMILPHRWYLALAGYRGVYTA